MSSVKKSESAFQKYLMHLGREKKRVEALSKDYSEKARHRFTFCGTDDEHEMIVCVGCDPEHDRPWCGDCHARRCHSCDKCVGCEEDINNCMCENFPQ